MDWQIDSSIDRTCYGLRPLWKGSCLSLVNFFLFALGQIWGAETADLLLEKAEGAYVSGDFRSALGLYDQFISEHASHDKVTDALYWRGRTLLAMDRFQEAQQAFHRAVEEAKDLSVKEESQLGYADSLYYVGELEGALSEYDALLSNRSSVHTPYLLYQIGSIWKGRGNMEKADTFFKELARNYPDSYEAHQMLKAKPLHAESLYFIQVGVFHVRSNVERLVPKIKRLQYACQVEEIRTASGKAYKVKVGGFHRDSEARRAVAEIEKITQVRGRVVRE